MRVREMVDADHPEELTVLVDNPAAAENVSRFLTSQGYAAQVKAQGADHLVAGIRDSNLPVADQAPVMAACATEDPRTLVLARADSLGRGDETLGQGLMKNFLLTLKEMGPSLWRLILVNSGVKLCCRGSASLEALQDLAGAGVSILVCGTCLNHYGLLEAKQVGEVTNMLDIVTSMQVAAKVITV
jgi:selenium metabolism protein YedF